MDPQRRGAWQVKPNPVGWFEIYVQDMARAARFYETVLGGTLQKLPAGDLDMMAFPWGEGSPGSPGALVCMKGVPSGGGGTLVYFSCEDCAVEEGRVAAAGGKVHRPKLSIGEHGFISLIVDPDGNMVGLHSRR
jgi:uncharacterized protein